MDKVVHRERYSRSGLDWKKRPVLTITPDTFAKAHRDGYIILRADKPDITKDGILNDSENKYKLNLKHTNTQSVIESAVYTMLFRAKFDFAPTALDADEAYGIFGTSVYLIKLSADGKYYLGFSDGTNGYMVEITWTSGDVLTFMAQAYNDGAPKATISKVSSAYAVTSGTNGTYDTTPSTITFTTAGTTTEILDGNDLNISLQHFSLLDYAPDAPELEMILAD